jgi:hypothetical protein
MRQIDQVISSAVEVKVSGAIPPLPHLSSWHSAELTKHSNKTMERVPLARHELTSKEESGLRRWGWRAGLLLLPWGHGDSQNVVVAPGGAHSNEGI